VDGTRRRVLRRGWRLRGGCGWRRAVGRQWPANARWARWHAH